MPYKDPNGDRNNKRKKYGAARSKVVKKLGGKCKRCRFDDPRALQIDHVDGGGKKDRAEFTNDYKYCLAVLADKTGKYQLLCANCNWIKRSEESETGTLLRAVGCG